MKKLLLIIILSLFLPATSFAVRVASLFQADLPVPSQAEDVRLAAEKLGFAEVLTKVSGDPDIISKPSIAPYLSKASDYVEEYSYQQDPSASTHYVMHIRYDETAINHILKNTGMQFWGENRPLILVWLGMDDAKQASWVIDEDHPPHFLTAFSTQAKKEGVPLIFPAMDATELAQVSPLDIKNMNMATLQALSKRYAPGAILIGYIKSNHPQFSSDWQLRLNDNQWQWHIDGENLEELTHAILSKVSATLASHYKSKNNHPTHWQVNLEIAHVDQRVDLKQLMNYVKQLTAVSQVELTGIQGDRIELSVVVAGSIETFQQNVLVNQHLVSKGQDTKQNKLLYEWVP